MELEVDGRPVSWRRDGALAGRPLLVLAHGAGAPYTSPFMELAAQGLVGRGLCVVRFHFPSMEEAQRTGRRRPPDPAARMLTTWRAMVDCALAMRRHGPLVIGGKSMGGRMASMLLAQGRAPETVGAVYLGYPLHPAGRPEKLRAVHLADVPVPQLFVQGEKDPLCRPALLRAALAGVRGARHLEIPGADHSLARSRKDPAAGADEWLDAVAAFVHEVAATPAG
ncbi:alpha/beta family hydrolase [Georgenia sp. SYP-B2076]|uniref:alpha/beta family hydrolase n=1 Tax=Georgenia sp. SYP-B2076 TaxID=2495881 RepID=UPI000F8E2948|nr:alpha/beta family hydrolase [Georgenia sp. SYP-B2076]